MNPGEIAKQDVVGEIWLVSLGATGAASADLFGQKVSSTNVPFETKPAK
jgi:hypothetical protein